MRPVASRFRRPRSIRDRSRAPSSQQIPAEAPWPRRNDSPPFSGCSRPAPRRVGSSTLGASGSSERADTSGGSTGGGTSGCPACTSPPLGAGFCLADGGPPCDCPTAGLCPGWCPADGGAPDAAVPCAGYCVADSGLSPQYPNLPAGYNAPAVPCDGGCLWLGGVCAGALSGACCVGLACATGAPDGQPFCCGPEGLLCSASAGDFCCGGCYSNGTCGGPAF